MESRVGSFAKFSLSPSHARCCIAGIDVSTVARFSLDHGDGASFSAVWGMTWAQYFTITQSAATTIFCFLLKLCSVLGIVATFF